MLKRLLRHLLNPEELRLPERVVDQAMAVRDRAYNSRLLEYYRHCYYFEIDQKHKISERVTWFLAVLGLLANISLFYLKRVRTLHATPAVIFFWILFVIGVIAGAIAMFYVVRLVGLPFLGHSYGWVPPPRDIQKFIEDAEKYNVMAAPKDGIDLNIVFDERLLAQFAECASANSDKNHRRSEFGYYANSWCVASFVFLLAAALPLAMEKQLLPLKPEHSVSEKTTHMSDKEHKPVQPVPTPTDLPQMGTPPPLDISNNPVKLAPTKPTFPEVMWLGEANEKDAAARLPQKKDGDGQ